MAKKATNTEQASNGNQAASGMPLFYTRPVPLDSKRHGDLALKKNFGLGFTAQVNAVPINLIEMPQVCHFYPIAFSADDTATPVALLGLRNNENLFLDKNNSWVAEAYIPAYIRRYPFIFSELPGREQLTLCADINDNTTEAGGDQKFFEADGQPSQLSKNALEFCKSYHAAAQQTQAFGRALIEQNLLIDRQAEINVADGVRINFGGFRIIDEQRLNQMPEEHFLQWRAKGWLPFVYAHLLSAAQWQRLIRMLSERVEKERKK